VSRIIDPRAIPRLAYKFCVSLRPMQARCGQILPKFFRKFLGGALPTSG
jgi:hypothetical protein